MIFQDYLNCEVVVYCVVPYSTFNNVFTGILTNESLASVTLTSVENEQENRKLQSITILKSYIVSIGQK